MIKQKAEAFLWQAGIWESMLCPETLRYVFKQLQYLITTEKCAFQFFRTVYLYRATFRGKKAKHDHSPFPSQITGF